MSTEIMQSKAHVVLKWFDSTQQFTFLQEWKLFLVN